MKPIIVVVEKTNTWYSAYLEGIHGIVTIGDSLRDIRSNMKEAIDLFIEASNEDSDYIPEALQEEYELNLKLDVNTFFEWLKKVMTQKGLS